MKDNKLAVALALVMLLIFATRNAVSDPEDSEQTVAAGAGNVTELEIGGSQYSNRWSGVYGNVSGSIVLKDANNYTMYSWDELLNPKGEIYASNSTVSSWSKVKCMNLSTALRGFNCTGQEEDCINITEIEGFFGMGANDPDGVDETFNQSKDINVGSINLTNCPATNLYVNETAQYTLWNQTLLTINNTEYIIFATQLENDEFGYDEKQWDYQLLVGDNGDDELTTTYYIYTEIA
ncbi:hypothetical protein JXA85_06050 [Candidatus Woesearchaeota archaeon]|nr:hypothetical protein [Candidatus Woesearchaeota archaeon]